MKSACIYNDRFNTSCIFHSQLLLACAFNALTVKTGLGAKAIARTHLKEQLGSQLAEIYIMFPFLLSWYAAIRGHSWLSTAGVHSALRPTPSCLAFGFYVSRFLLESRYWGTKSLYSRYDLLFTFCVSNVCLSQISLHFTQWALSCTNTDGIQILHGAQVPTRKDLFILGRNRLQFTPRCKILEPRRFVVSQQDAVSVSHTHMLLLHLKAPLTWLLWYEDIPCTVWRIAAFSFLFFCLLLLSI